MSGVRGQLEELGAWLGEDFPDAEEPASDDVDDDDDGPRVGGIGGVDDRQLARSGGGDAGDWGRAPAGAPADVNDVDDERSGSMRGARSDAGVLRLTERDVASLLFLGEMYGAQVDQLEQLLATSPGAVRQVLWRWRKGGLVETTKLGPGPQWCYLTRKGLELTGLGYSPRPPSLARLRHVRAVVAVRLTLEAWPLYRDAGGRWRSERELRAVEAAARPGVGRVGHVPDGEIVWGSTDHDENAGGQFAGQVWAVEVELTPKTTDRTAAIMAELLSRIRDYGEPATSSESAAAGARYSRVLYLVTGAARAKVEAARARLPETAARRIEVRPVPASGVTPTTTSTSGTVGTIMTSNGGAA
jgi:hypothetical protein